MNTEKWLEKNAGSLAGKTVALTGATGGLGREICRYVARLGGSLLLLDRNRERSLALKERLIEEFGQVNVRNLTVDLEDMQAVKAVCRELEGVLPDIFIHNAGAYSIPRRVCDTGYNNVFQINFVSPYYITHKLIELKPDIKILAVGSIAHSYSKTDPEDIDFSKRTASSLIYGNAKRYLMFSLWELLRERGGLAVVHPGITFTNITSHYPPWLYAIIKYPMKIIFMRPEKAALACIKGIFEPCGYCEWIGPRFFDVWGLPKKRPLKTCTEKERSRIYETAEKIYSVLEKENECLEPFSVL